MLKPTKIYIVTGEPSGDILAASLMRAIKLRLPEATFCGIGGESMTALGFQSLFDIKELAVMGIFDVIPQLRNLLRRLREVTDDVIQQQPDVLVTVDSWGFTSDLLARLKKRNCTIPKVHYVAPQVWAWKKGRAQTLAGLTDCVMTLLPFEPPYFEKFGLRSEFVGHPVIENTKDIVPDREGFLQQYAIPSDSLLVSILPGSRPGEVKRLLPILLDAAQYLQKKYPHLHLLIPSVKTVAKAVEAQVKQREIPFTMIQGEQKRYQAFAVSAVALAASGTVSLELAACGTPHMITYSMSTLTNYFIKYVLRIKFANLLNIIEDREIIPEMMFDKCNGESMGELAHQFLIDPVLKEKQLTEMANCLHKFYVPNTLPSHQAAAIVTELIN